MTRKHRITCYVAFLRGINVGGHRLQMETLRNLFATLGFAKIATFIASGNVIFETMSTEPSEIETRIEAHLRESLGYDVDTFLRTPAELASIVAFRPFHSLDADAPDHTLHVGFLRTAVGDEVERKLASFRGEMDDFHVHGRELFWLCRGKVTDSKVSWPLVAKTLATSSTMRNLKTIRKLAALYPPE